MGSVDARPCPLHYLASHDVLVGLLEVGEGLEADGAELIDPALDLVLGVRLLLEDLADGLVEEGLDLLGDEGELREEGARGGGGWTGRRGGGEGGVRGTSGTGAVKLGVKLFKPIEGCEGGGGCSPPPNSGGRP